MTEMGIPVQHDEFGQPISPRFVEAQPADYLGYTKEVAESFVSCICSSQTFFHLRWAYYDDAKDEDDGLALCRRKRGRDKDGFWRKGGCCEQCAEEVHAAAECLGDDFGWFPDEFEKGKDRGKSSEM